MGKAVWGRLIVFFSSKGTDWRLQMIESFHYSVAGCVHALGQQRTCLSEIRRKAKTLFRSGRIEVQFPISGTSCSPTGSRGASDFGKLIRKMGGLKATCGLA